METLDFGWGNPYFLLDILNGHKNNIHSVIPTKAATYGPDNGMLGLVAWTKQVIKWTTGLEYEHVLITNGATGAINSALRYAVSQGAKEVATDKFGYPFYDGMIKKAGLERKRCLTLPRPPHNTIQLIDSPSNPEGKQTNIGSPYNTIWDSVYHNDIYTDDLKTYPQHSLMVGSYSKLLGITGARVGWLATNDKKVFDAIAYDTLMENATISIFSQQAILDISTNLFIPEFMHQGKNDLNSNRTELQKIEHIFDKQPVQKNGMFYLAQADKAAIRLLEKCKIKYVDLEDNYVRINIGQTKHKVDNFVLRILKEDRV